MTRETKLLTVQAVCERLAISRPHLYRLRDRAGFPAPIYVASRSPRWRDHEIEAWIASQSASYDAA